jgi:hypothetical protein
MVERDAPETLNASQVRALLRYVESFKDGCLVPYFALALFAGLRTGSDGELQKLAWIIHEGKKRAEFGAH